MAPIYDLRVNNTNQTIPNSVFGSNFVLGVAATGDITVQNSDIQASNSTDNIDVAAIAADNNALVENVTAYSLNTGNSLSAGNSAQGYAVYTFNTSTISNSTLTAVTSGNANGSSSITRALGFEAEVTLILQNQSLTRLAAGHQ